MLLSLDTSKNRGAGISHRKKNKDMTNLFFRNGNSRRKKWMIVQSANDS